MPNDRKERLAIGSIAILLMFCAVIAAIIVDCFGGTL